MYYLIFLYNRDLIFIIILLLITIKIIYNKILTWEKIMKIFNLLFLVAVSILFLNKVALSLETKTIIDLQLAKKMADACEAK